jgi:hypothetical protein
VPELDLRLLQSFLVVAEEGGMTVALLVPSRSRAAGDAGAVMARPSPLRTRSGNSGAWWPRPRRLVA